MTNLLKKYVTLLALLGIFFAPGVAAYLVFQHPEWISSSKINKGALLSPALALNIGNKNNKWQLAFWSPEPCEVECLKSMDKLARIRLALGRKLYSLDQWLFLGGHASPLPETTQSLFNENDIHYRVLSAKETHKLEGIDPKYRLFIVSPDQYLVLAYPKDVNPEDVYNDLKILLKSTEQQSG